MTEISESEFSATLQLDDCNFRLHEPILSSSFTDGSKTDCGTSGVR